MTIVEIRNKKAYRVSEELSDTTLQTMLSDEEKYLKEAQEKVTKISANIVELKQAIIDIDG